LQFKNPSRVTSRSQCSEPAHALSQINISCQ
jgi:hypothetical protein